MKRPRFRWLEWAILVLFLGQVAIGVGTYVNTEDLHRQAAQGHIAYRAECTYFHDLQSRIHQSEKFLALTLEQRIAKYGQALGSIPPASIRVSLLNERRAVQSLRGLRC